MTSCLTIILGSEFLENNLIEILKEKKRIPFTVIRSELSEFLGIRTSNTLSISHTLHDKPYIFLQNKYGIAYSSNNITGIFGKFLKSFLNINNYKNEI